MTRTIPERESLTVKFKSDRKRLPDHDAETGRQRRGAFYTIPKTRAKRAKTRARVSLRVSRFSESITNMRDIDWPRLLGRTFQTIKGARFTVVRVTPRYVTIRPENGTRDYALSIPGELERVLDAYAAGQFFPAPTELPRVGVRPVLTSYVWGVLHAVMAEQAAGEQGAATPPERIAGHWHIVEMAEFDEQYFGMGEKRPFIEIESKRAADLRGEYGFGLSNGYFDGALREFGGEQVFLFGYEGNDEMDAVSGCGWLRLTSPDELAGEFVNTYGRFTAKRDQPKPEKRRRKH